MPQRFDVIIIGSGAGGATLAQRLAPSGKSILILERGEHLVREAENWDAKAVFVDHRYRTREQWLDSEDRPFTPNTHYWVGGNTTFYGAALMRLRESDFQEVRHAGGLSLAWPISLTDMAPYYAEAETLWQVHGERGVEGFRVEFTAFKFCPGIVVRVGRIDRAQKILRQAAFDLEARKGLEGAR